MKTALIRSMICLAGVMITTSSQAELIPYDVAVLQGLNKITARVSEFNAPLNQTVKFGTLEITARDCRKSPPEDMPESASFLEIDDVKENVEKARMFTGWMFASSPAVSAMEHPVYDVWVVDCKTAEEAAESSIDGATSVLPE
ncbi:DUF2155 domain-containing protein [Kiloniella sp.]|uniref:DUF2155 domain-containing protein n=1 Tax=Kiloniella sp. TaxID=1938587 RepID=UPI003B02545F